MNDVADNLDNLINPHGKETMLDRDGHVRWIYLNIAPPVEGALIVVRRSDGTVSSGYFRTDQHHWWSRSADEKCGLVEWAYISA